MTVRVLAILLAILLALLAVTAYAGVAWGRAHVNTERLCSDPSHNDDHVWHCWTELK